MSSTPQELTISSRLTVGAATLPATKRNSATARWVLGAPEEPHAGILKYNGNGQETAEDTTVL